MAEVDKMSFETQGFLANSDNWIDEVRNNNQEWFKLIHDLNSSAMQMLFQAKPAENNNKELVGSILFARALQSFQSAILLAERGLLVDANTLIRSSAEATLALGGINCVENFLELLIEDHHKHKKALANSFLNDEQHCANLTPEQILELQRHVEKIKQQYPDQAPKSINWEDIAKQSCTLVIYNTIYRELSAKGAHVTIDSLDHHIKADAAGNIESLIFAPNKEKIIEVLSTAINTVIFAGMFHINLFDLNDVIEKKWKEYFLRWQKLNIT